MRTKKSQFSALEIGMYFLYLGNKEKKPITNKKLQKLLYYAQAWSLVLRNDKKLFNDKIEAWLHGPAIPEVYHQYKSFSFHPIKVDLDLELIKSIHRSTGKFLNSVWNVYGKLDASYLEVLSHKEDPWQIARSGVGEFNPSDNEITLKSMKDYYSKMLKEIKKDGKKI